jgi:hypothetical protein
MTAISGNALAELLAQVVEQPVGEARRAQRALVQVEEAVQVVQVPDALDQAQAVLLARLAHLRAGLLGHPRQDLLGSTQRSSRRPTRSPSAPRRAASTSAAATAGVAPQGPP